MKLQAYFQSIKVQLILLAVYIALSVPVQLYQRLAFLQVFFTSSVEWIIVGLLAAWAGMRAARIEGSATSNGMAAGALLGLFGGIIGGFLGALMIVEKGFTLMSMLTIIFKEAGVGVIVYGLIAAVAASIAPKH